MKLLLKNARYLNPGDVPQHADIAVVDDTIYKVGKVTDFEPDKLIDAKKFLVIPGIVDLSARLREPGQIKKGSIHSETKAAVGGGITTVCLPPDTNPIIDTSAVVELVDHRQKQAGFAKVHTIGAMTDGLVGEKLANMGALQSEGCVGVSNGFMPFASLDVLKKAIEYAATLDLVIHLHPLNHDLIADGAAHSGAVNSILGLPGIPYSAETVALAEILLIAEEANARVHLCRLSSAKAVTMVREAKSRGINISADVGVAHLFFTEQNLSGFDSNFHMLPPFRTQEDREVIRRGVLDKTIDAICSDHQPHDVDAKLKPFSETDAGMSTLDGFVPQILKFCREEKVELTDILELITLNPARIIGQNNGLIAPGKAADFALLDTEKKWQLNSNTILSHGLNTPLLGQDLLGQNCIGIVNGQVVFDRQL